MPLLVAAFLGALIQGAGTLVGRVLISLGVSYAAYTGIDSMVQAARDTLVANISGQSAIVVQLAGVLQIGTCINILTSAYLARLVVMGLQNGALTAMRIKG